VGKAEQVEKEEEEKEEKEEEKEEKEEEEEEVRLMGSTGTRTSTGSTILRTSSDKSCVIVFGCKFDTCKSTYSAVRSAQEGQRG